MAIPVSRFPALETPRVLELLATVGYEQQRRSGLHRILTCAGRKRIVFAFHRGAEVPPAALRHMLVNRAGLSGADDPRLTMSTTPPELGERLMHEVRVCLNRLGGTLWWAEDDRGYTGGADTLAELVASVHEWAESEGTLDDLALLLVGAPVPPRPAVEFSSPAQPTTEGVPAVRVATALIPCAALHS